MFCSCFIADCPYIMPQVKTGWLLNRGGFTYPYMNQSNAVGNFTLETPRDRVDNARELT